MFRKTTDSFPSTISPGKGSSILISMLAGESRQQQWLAKQNRKMAATMRLLAAARALKSMSWPPLMAFA